MVAADMDITDNIDVETEEHDSEKQEANQVVIFESGKPLLKIQTGTTLQVMKLLYEAECKNASHDIIGVRPRVTSEIPCIVTLSDSKLEEAAYDLIVKDRREMSPPSPSINHVNERNGHCVTTRCIDCSREAWKAKRYTSVGMNTEISINPLLEMDSLRPMSLQNSYSATSQASSENTYPARSRGRPPSVQRPLPPAPAAPHPSLVYSAVHKKDYIVSLPTVAVAPQDLEYYDRACYPRHHSPRRSPVHMQSNGRTQISYPMVRKAMDLDSVPYDGMHPLQRHVHRSPPRSRCSPTHHLLMKGELSPPRRTRSRSPVIPHNSFLKAEGIEVYYPRRTEEVRTTKYVRSSSQFPQYEQHATTNETHIQPEEHTPQADVEPPVYVLPNDFDMKRDPLEPHIASFATGRPYLPAPRSTLQNNQPSKTDRNSPNGSDSGKSAEETTSQEAPVERTLSCKICKETFPTKSTLYKHLRGHSSDEKPFKCNECGQGFTLSSNLRQHRIIHRGYKPFQCEYCGKKFMRSNVYKQHRRIHTGEQMHKCDLCPSEFLQRYALIKHMKKTHNIDAMEN